MLLDVSSEQFQVNFLIVVFQSVAHISYTTSFLESATFPILKKDELFYFAVAKRELNQLRFATEMTLLVL